MERRWPLPEQAVHAQPGRESRWYPLLRRGVNYSLISQLTVTLLDETFCVVSNSYSLEELADSVHAWCEDHRVLPANGQVAETITERTIRYYRTIGLLDAPLGGYVKSFNEKHRLQLLAIRLYQALGLPLRKIREELYGKSEEMLEKLIRKPARRKVRPLETFEPAAFAEQWTVFPLTAEFLLVSRQGRSLPPGVLTKLKEAFVQVQPTSTTDPGSN